ncbi:hypothetical protein DPV78_004418 [Talaromyces pinophilus]|nr:hypothetical protein DPV78_004418 [Talaromyces pinophilus]
MDVSWKKKIKLEIKVPDVGRLKKGGRSVNKEGSNKAQEFNGSINPDGVYKQLSSRSGLRPLMCWRLNALPVSTPAEIGALLDPLNNII